MERGLVNNHPGNIPAMGGEQSFLSLYLQTLANRLSNNENQTDENIDYTTLNE